MSSGITESAIGGNKLSSTVDGTSSKSALLPIMEMESESKQSAVSSSCHGTGGSNDESKAKLILGDEGIRRCCSCC